MGDPYRDAPDETRALVPLRAHRPRQVQWATILAATTGAATLLIGLPANVVAGCALTCGVLGYAALALLRGRHARRVLSRLPFPVALANDAGADVARPIREVELEHASPLAGPQADDLAALWTAHSLTVRTAATSLVLTGWRWGAGDLAILADLLERTGRTHHSLHPIARVTVRWAATPTASI